MRAAIDRRGELGLTQEELAERSGVSARTITDFESFRIWPRARTLGQLERLGLNWPVGHLREIADDIDHEEAKPDLTQEQADLLLQRQLIVREFFQRRVELLRLVAEIQRALDGDRPAEAKRFADDIEKMLRDSDPI